MSRLGRGFLTTRGPAGKTFLVWVMPTGDIEVADDDPWLANLYMNSQIGVPHG